MAQTCDEKYRTFFIPHTKRDDALFCQAWKKQEHGIIEWMKRTIKHKTWFAGIFIYGEE